MSGRWERGVFVIVGGGGGGGGGWLLVVIASDSGDFGVRWLISSG